ncbi:MAG: hypothetical protein EZS28_048222, partial [Streblomastix strix]
EFTLTFNDDGCDQMDKIMGPIDVDKLMYKNIMDSNCIEQDILSKDNINDAIEYLKSNKVPQIEGLYQALFKRETFRHCSVYVSDKNNSKIISAANVGIQHENIDPNELQQLVDFAYEYDQSNKVMVFFGETMKKRQIKSGDTAIYRVEIQEMDLNRFYEIINDNQRTKQQYYTLDLDDNTSERIAAEQRSRAQQKYRIQRQEFRASANDLQLLLIRRLQKTIITNVQDLLQISDIIDQYNQ